MVNTAQKIIHVIYCLDYIFFSPENSNVFKVSSQKFKSVVGNLDKKRKF